jgi:glycosyltransferase involved in cell wall biosynthesis
VAVIEAMSCGCAPVCTRVGGVPELINNEQNGLLVAERSSDEIATALNRLMSDQELLRRLATAARQTAVDRFDTALQARKVISELAKKT